jgi:thiamine-phosphate pyrophosphorylase
VRRAAVHRCFGIVSDSEYVAVPVLRRTTALRSVLRRARETVKMTPPRPRQRLYLVTPALNDTASFAPDLDAALGAGDIAAVLLRLAESDERALAERAKAIAAIVQRRDVALLLDGRSEIVGRAGADGAHLTGIEAFTAALATLKPERIAGAGGFCNRHYAMLASEAGADYLMFGDGRRASFDVALEYLTWSAQLLELPCIGYAASADEVLPLARTGADFVALGDWIWTHPEGAAAAVTKAAENLGAPAP